MLFDALLHKGKPDIGLPKCAVLYEQEMWPTADRSQPPTAFPDKPGAITCLDIERWPPPTVEWFQQTIDGFRAAHPQKRVGFYGYPEGKWELWDKGINDPQSIALRDRMKQYRILADAADFTAPSLYARHPDPQQWLRVAVNAIAMAKDFGEICYPFLWPEFYDGSPYAGQPVPVDFWRLQIEVCERYADGAIIWGGYLKQWDESAPWWVATKAYL